MIRFRFLPPQPEPAAPTKPARTTFQAVKGKYRKPGTGCVTQISDHLWEGRHSPKKYLNMKHLAGKEVRNILRYITELGKENIDSTDWLRKKNVTALKMRNWYDTFEQLCWNCLTTSSVTMRK